MAEELPIIDAAPPQLPGEDVGVEIHKPKPWRGFRGFLNEYLIIVVGVLTALALEQSVEWLHRHAEVRDARATLRFEIADNAGDSRFTVEQERCLQARLDQFVAWASGGPHPAKVAPGVIGFAQPHTSTWDVVKGGAASHMSLKEQVAYSRFYDTVAILLADEQAEGPVWLQLGGLYSRAALDPADAQVVLATVYQARALGTNRASVAGRLIERAKDVGVQGEPMSARRRVALESLCGSVGLAAPR